jgi:transcriptional regulator with XRE-family HTH domain
VTKSISFAQWSEPYCIGMKLRLLRMKKRLTLARLAEETGLSTALLSKLETNRMIPTLPTLAVISRVYGVAMSYFFSEPSSHTLSITRRAHLQGDGRSVDSVKSIPLSAVTEGTQLVAQMLELPAGIASSFGENSYQTSSLLYVLEGRLQVNTGGVQEALEKGDCIHLESKMAVALSAVGKLRCRVLAVMPNAARTES